MGFTETKAYSFDLKREIDLAAQTFPQLEGDMFFVAARHQSISSNPAYECYGAAWEKHKDIPERVKVVREAVIKTLETGQSRAVRGVKQPNLKFIVIYFSYWSRPSVDMVFTFDHELGHQLVPSGFDISHGDELLGESAADAFAALRFMQRFGREAGKKQLMQKSTDRLIAPITASHYKGDWVHLTAAVLMRVIKDADIAEFETLSPPETIEMAEYIATQYSPSEEQMKKHWQELRGATRAGAAAALTDETALLEEAERGGAAEKYAMARRYDKGKDGVAKDMKKALAWYLRAAALGHAPAQYCAGFAYHRGVGAEKNPAEAFKWYRLAAEQGHAPGQLALGDLYERGIGVAKDEAKAVEWYRRVSDQGEPWGHYYLGLMYRRGKGVAEDKKEWKRLCLLAAEGGYRAAQFEQGEICAGWPVEMDWYFKAAEQGHPEARKKLIAFHKAGKNMKPAIAEAAKKYQAEEEKASQKA